MLSKKKIIFNSFSSIPFIVHDNKRIHFSLEVYKMFKKKCLPCSEIKAGKNAYK